MNIAFDSRFIRSSMLDSLNQDFVRTARAKGVPERTVIFRHALRNALLPVVTNIGLEIPFLFTGAIVTETIFSWPGMGRAFIEATGHFDYPVLMGILIVTSVIVVGANLIADVAYADRRSSRQVRLRRRVDITGRASEPLPTDPGCPRTRTTKSTSSR